MTSRKYCKIGGIISLRVDSITAVGAPRLTDNLCCHDPQFTHDQSKILIERPDLMPTAVEELLRVFAPQQALARTATRDVEINGKQIKAGDKILMCWAAGNRDAAEFADPEKIDFEREVNRHMTFGMGVHRCMGSNIARDEAKRCLHEVLTRLPDYKIVGTRSAGDVGIVYGYSEVKVTFTPGKRSTSN